MLLTSCIYCLRLSIGRLSQLRSVLPLDLDGNLVNNEHNRADLITAINLSIHHFTPLLLQRLATLLTVSCPYLSVCNCCANCLLYSQPLTATYPTPLIPPSGTLKPAALFIWKKVPQTRSSRTHTQSRYRVFFCLKTSNEFANIQLAFMLTSFIDDAWSMHVGNYDHDPRALPRLTGLAYMLSRTPSVCSYGVLDCLNLDTAYCHHRTSRSLSATLRGHVISSRPQDNYPCSDLMQSVRYCLAVGR